MSYWAFKTQTASFPKTPVTFFHPTRCHTPRNVCHQHTPVYTNIAFDYTSSLVMRQRLCRFLELILASHVTLTPKLDNPGRLLFLTFLKIYFGIFENFISITHHRTAHRQHTVKTHICLAVISNQARVCMYEEYFNSNTISGAK
jgi:hypothetical protein